MTRSRHSPTAPEARQNKQNLVRYADPLVSLPTAERPKAMHVQNMILCLVTVFLLAAAFLWATYDPDMTSGESTELMEAYNSYDTLYQQGRFSEAEPYAKEALKKNWGPKSLVPMIQPLPPFSTTWRNSIEPKATMRRPSRSTSALWRSGKRPGDPSIRMWPRAWKTMLHCSERPRARTRQRRWRAAPRRSVRSPSDRWRRP